MRLFGNLIWFIFGGFFMGLAWWLAGLLAALTIIGIPFAIAAFRIGTFSFWPFGRQIVPQPNRGEVHELLDFLANILWIIFGGLWLAIGHLVWALIFTITIIGVPFAVQHLKLARLSFTPYGKRIVAAAQV